MTIENEKQAPSEHKIHKTHFPVIKIPLKDDGQERKFEWVDIGNGHWKRIPKVTQKTVQDDDSLHLDPYST